MVSLVCAAGYILVSIIENVSFVNVISNIYVFGTYFCINVTFSVHIATYGQNP